MEIRFLLLDLPSVPFNLTIVERKKGKTVILQWNSDYDKTKPVIFVVEGKWSLNYNQNDEEMTKWGYLAQVSNPMSIESLIHFVNGTLIHYLRL